jgi:RNA polymerase sigma-70 factor, ECF subfamily
LTRPRPPSTVSGGAGGGRYERRRSGARNRRREELLDAFLPRQLFAAPDADIHLDLDRLEACLAQLSERERTVVCLTFYGERPAVAVAKEIGATEGHVRVIRHRALAQLRTCVTSGQAPS